MDKLVPIEDLEELKSIELSILCKFHQFCEEYGLNYYLAYGTLIGAIRHHGFIPWDDDIDVMMMRKDYDKFLELFPGWADDHNLFLASAFSENHPYVNIFSKVCQSNTSLKESMMKIDPDLGIFIDIFPVDHLPQSHLKRALVHSRLRILRRMLVASNLDTHSDDFFTHYSKSKRIIISCMNKLSPRKVFDKINRIAHDMEQMNSDYLMVYFSSIGCIFRTEWFDKKILVPFEDKEFYVPSGYHELLTSVYGDYMTLPPEDEQIPHHVMNVYKVLE